VGHHAPVGSERAAVEQPEGGLGVAYIEDEYHASSSNTREPERHVTSPTAVETRSEPRSSIPCTTPGAGRRHARPRAMSRWAYAASSVAESPPRADAAARMAGTIASST